MTEKKLTYKDHIYAIVERIPEGRVMSYGQIARMVPRCTARMVGFAMASCPEGLPWQRVINSQGKISPRGVGYGAELQRSLLEDEGVIFDEDGRTSFDQFGWQPE
jgi:methylated-DNA-protein-cysteine methyltransferase-like protein